MFLRALIILYNSIWCYKTNRNEWQPRKCRVYSLEIIDLHPIKCNICSSMSNNCTPNILTESFHSKADMFYDVAEACLPLFSVHEKK